MLGSILGAVGGIASSILGNSAADKQADLQKDFAKKAIRWKVADAKAAGIHPLYALGANTVSYSPVSVGTPDLGAMGQDIGQAIDRVSNPGEKMSGALGALALERAGLENDLLRAQIARARINVAGQVAGPVVAGAPGLIPSKIVDPQLTTGVNVAGAPMVSNPNFSDAQTLEDRHGEIAGAIGGLMNIPADMYWNFYRPGMGKKRSYRNPYYIGRR